MALQNLKQDALGNAAVIDLDTAVTGSITAAAQTITLNLGGDSGYALEVQGTFVGTLQIERTVDGTTWRPVNGAVTGVGTIAQTLTGPGSLQGHSGPSMAMRVNATAWTSGTATVMLRAGVGSGAVFMVAPLPAGGNAIGTVGITALPALTAGSNLIGVVKEYRAPTSAVNSVASLATTATLLAANANRNGATFYNASTSVLYLKLGATASLTSYSVQIAAGGYYEVPAWYSGVIDGLWASANGAVLVSEVS